MKLAVPVPKEDYIGLTSQSGEKVLKRYIGVDGGRFVLNIGNYHIPIHIDPDMPEGMVKVVGDNGNVVTIYNLGV